MNAVRLELWDDPTYWKLLNVFVDPGKRRWEIHRAGAEPVVLRDGDRFEVPDVLPGFGLLVAELWPE